MKRSNRSRNAANTSCPRSSASAGANPRPRAARKGSSRDPALPPPRLRITSSQTVEKGWIHGNNGHDRFPPDTNASASTAAAATAKHNVQRKLFFRARKIPLPAGTRSLKATGLSGRAQGRVCSLWTAAARGMQCQHTRRIDHESFDEDTRACRGHRRTGWGDRGSRRAAGPAALSASMAADDGGKKKGGFQRPTTPVRVCSRLGRLSFVRKRVCRFTSICLAQISP